MREKIENSTNRLMKWIEGAACKGYEPFDGLSSPIKKYLGGNLLMERLLLQFVRQSPINVRRLLGIRPLDSTKGRGYVAAGYFVLSRTYGEKSYLEKGKLHLDWLKNNKSPKYDEYSWANHFPFASRGGKYDKDEPIIVWTSLIGQAFLDGYELTGNGEYLEVAESACRWVMSLPREKTENGTCLSYLATEQSSIHNSNMLGAALLARTSSIRENREFLKTAEAAMRYSCERQLTNGAWYYAERDNMHWIDNFHTGYNLDSLKCYMDCTGDLRYESNLKSGLDFYISNFFEPSGRPKYYHNRTYPVDSQCAAQAIESLATMSPYDGRALPLSIKVANWWIDNMQDREGYFYYRQYPLIKAKTPMLHWSQATTFKGLAVLLSKMGSQGSNGN